MSRLGMAFAAGALGLCLCVRAPVAAGPADAEPPTIEKVIFDARGEAAIEGEGQPGTVVRLTSDGSPMGEARVQSNRRWRVVLKSGLAPGTYQIRALAFPGPSEVPLSGDEIRVAVPAGPTSAVVTYDGVRGDDVSPETRRRAEGLAEAAGQAYDELAPRTGAVPQGRTGADEATREAEPEVESRAPPAQGPLAVVVDWLKRSARAYREEIAGKLTVPEAETAAPVPETEAEPDEAVSAADAARRIAEERRRAQEARERSAAAEKARQAAEAAKAAERKAREEASARKQADELARRKAETDERIARELEALKTARAEADARAAAAGQPAAAPPEPKTERQKITLEAFTLPGDAPRPDAQAGDGRRRERQIAGTDAGGDREVRARPSRRTRDQAGRCGRGRVVHRNGRRWYVTGRDDTLWDIAERFYGSGLAYPRIYRVNRSRLSSPHIVRPCLALRMPRGRR